MLRRDSIEAGAARLLAMQSSDLAAPLLIGEFEPLPERFYAGIVLLVPVEWRVCQVGDQLNLRGHLVGNCKTPIYGPGDIGLKSSPFFIH